MKKLLLFLAVYCYCIAMITAQVERKVLVEEFTNASCPPCAAQNPAFNALLKANEDRIVALKYQTNFPGYDPMNQQNPGEVNTRRGYYGITGVPTATIDGVIPGNNYGGGGLSRWIFPDGSGYNGGPYGYNQAVLDYAKGRSTNISIELDHEITPNLDTIHVFCKVKNLGNTTFNPSDARLHLAVTEEEIIFPTSPGTTNEREFFHVMRKMLPNAAGTSLAAIPANDSLVFDLSFTLPSYLYNFTEVGLVAFVQDHATRTIYQSERSEKKPLPQGGIYVRLEVEDRTLAPSSPCVQTVNPKLLVRNTFSTALDSFVVNYSINGEFAGSKQWKGALGLNELTVVNFGDVNLPEPGTYSLSYEVTDINGSVGVINIDPTSTTTQSGVFGILPSDPIGEEIAYDMEGDAILTFPENTVSSNYDGIGRTFQTVDKSVFNIAAPVGSYGQSEKSILIDFYNWDAVSSGVSLATLTLAKADLTNLDAAYLLMDRAYAVYPGSFDRLQLLVSTDCGNSWTIVGNRAGGGLITAPSSLTEFVPTADQWESDTFDISAYVGQEINIGVRALTGNGNQAYLDNIQIKGDISTSTKTINLLTDKVTIFPNPIMRGEAAQIEFELTVPAKRVNVDVYDVHGAHVANLIKRHAFGTGTHLVDWQHSTASGVYFVKISSEYGETTQKLVVF